MKTKIIATLGPATSSETIMRDMVRAGMSIARFNFSHADIDQYKKERTVLQRIAQEEGKNVVCMQDVQGPRLRVGELPKEGILLRINQEVTFSTDNSDTGTIYIEDPYLHADIHRGDPIFLSNGAIELETVGIKGSHIQARVLRGGTLFSHKAVNVPYTRLTTKGLTEKDKKDIAAVAEIGVEYIAVSFVQSAQDIQEARDLIPQGVKVIAKIERKQALEHIDDIIRASDGVMVARGDLGAEIPLETVPLVQKDIIRHANWHEKPAIVATQMLLSMVGASHPTRAEVSDVVNAILDGADAVMLSDETASGKYPVEAVAIMNRIITHVEAHMRRESRL